jgi:hypothetical protein
MAQFECCECKKLLVTGEKFTFTKKGSVHFDCFISAKRKELDDSKAEEFRVLSLLLDSELTHLINLINIKSKEGPGLEFHRLKYKDVEKAAGDTTKKISEL